MRSTQLIILDQALDAWGKVLDRKIDALLDHDEKSYGRLALEEELLRKNLVKTASEVFDEDELDDFMQSVEEQLL